MRGTRNRVRFAALLAAAALIAGCAGLGTMGREAGPAERLTRIGRETAEVARIEGKGRAKMENRLGEIEIEFELVYEPGGLLEVEGELAPGFLPFDGEISLLSTPDTTFAFAEGVPLMARGRSYPGPVGFPALVGILLGGDWVLGWIEEQGCRPDRELNCGGIAFEFDLDEDTGRVKGWTLKDENSGGSYEGFLYRSRRRGGLDLPEILTGIVHPLEIAVYVEYYEINATDGK
jgi:hypothetical protein